MAGKPFRYISLVHKIAGPEKGCLFNQSLLGLKGAVCSTVSALVEFAAL